MKYTQDEIRSRKAKRAELAEEYPKKLGRQHYLKYLYGGDLTLLQAVQSHCFACNGGHELDDDGSADCTIFECSLYPYQPYQQHIVRKKKKAGSNFGRNKSVPNTGNLSQT